MSKDLLSKCFHGSTQNNESLNALTWKHYPKDVYVGVDILNLGCCSAIIISMIYLMVLTEFLKKLYVKPGHYCSIFFFNY